MVTVVSRCKKCKRTYTWKSQPNLLQKFPAGNLLLSFEGKSLGFCGTSLDVENFLKGSSREKLVLEHLLTQHFFMFRFWNIC